MKIELPGGGTLEPDLAPRNTPFHKRILRTHRIPNTRTGHYADLECGHRVWIFGNLAMAGGVALCTQCRDGEGKPAA